MEENSIDNLVLCVKTPEGGEICLSYKPPKEAFVLTYWMRGNDLNYMEQMIIKKEDNLVDEAMVGFFDEDGINEIVDAGQKKLPQHLNIHLALKPQHLNIYFALKKKLEEINETYRKQQAEDKITA